VPKSKIDALKADTSNPDAQDSNQSQTGILSRLWQGLAKHGHHLNERRQQQWLAQACETLYSEIGEAAGVVLARRILECYAKLTPAAKLDFLTTLEKRFSTEPSRINLAISEYQQSPNAKTSQQLHQATQSRRQEVIRRLNFAPSGISALLLMREDIINLLATHPELNPVDADFEHLFRSWFNRGFLQMQTIDWNTPAVILEKIIRYEAVHAISDWHDLRRRLDPPDRKCFAFFHPMLANDPLIFVEVALTEHTPNAIAPLLAEERTPIDPSAARTAVFYSISNCQKGLKGVSFGNFLIKQVAAELQRDFPQLRTFVTLSPIPGFTRWLHQQHGNSVAAHALNEIDWQDPNCKNHPMRPILERYISTYLLEEKLDRLRPADPVARFQLGNGASIENIHWLGDISTKGTNQGASFMVNYLYDLDHVIANHEAHIKHGTIIASRQVRALSESKNNQ